MGMPETPKLPELEENQKVKLNPILPDMSGTEVGFHIFDGEMRFKIDIKKKNVTTFSLLCYFGTEKDQAKKNYFKYGCEMNKDYIQIIRDGVNHSFTVTKNKFIDAFNKGKEAVNKAVNETVSNVKEAATKVKEAATKENIKKAYNKGKEAVKETVTKENIKKAYNKGKEAVQETISDVKENIKTFHLIIKENDYNFGKMLMKPGKALIEEAKKKNLW